VVESSACSEAMVECPACATTAAAARTWQQQNGIQHAMNVARNWWRRERIDQVTVAAMREKARAVVVWPDGKALRHAEPNIRVPVRFVT
jgi:hypothetical protein